jgi:hypothetical protein
MEFPALKLSEKQRKHTAVILSCPLHLRAFSRFSTGCELREFSACDKEERLKELLSTGEVTINSRDIGDILIVSAALQLAGGTKDGRVAMSHQMRCHQFERPTSLLFDEMHHLLVWDHSWSK